VKAAKNIFSTGSCFAIFTIKGVWVGVDVIVDFVLNSTLYLIK
jgi:hypothetical protein